MAKPVVAARARRCGAVSVEHEDPAVGPRTSASRGDRAGRCGGASPVRRPCSDLPLGLRSAGGETAVEQQSLAPRSSTARARSRLRWRWPPESVTPAGRPTQGVLGSRRGSPASSPRRFAFRRSRPDGVLRRARVVRAAGERALRDRGGRRGTSPAKCRSDPLRSAARSHLAHVHASAVEEAPRRAAGSEHAAAAATAHRCPCSDAPCVRSMTTVVPCGQR